MASPTFHALLIGIDHYFPNKLSNGGEYRSLGGCVQDVERVAAMLAVRLGSLKEEGRLQIQVLAASDRGGQAGGDPSSWPTAENIRKALAELIERTQPGDQVYLHYSGHGGRVSTLWKDWKGEQGVDEALVPMDIGSATTPGGPPLTHADRYIRDVELAHYLDRLASKQDGQGNGIVTTLVFDACHSGGVTRGTEIALRCATGGTPSTDDPQGTLDRPAAQEKRVFTAEELEVMAAAALRFHAESSARVAMSGGTPWLPPARSYVLLAACRDVEAALEASIDGLPRAGVLTSAYLEALSTLGREQSWKIVYDRVLAQVHSRFSSQTPQLVGDIERQVLGARLLPVELTLTVTAIDAPARTVMLNGGKAMALGVGTEVGIYRPGETDFSLVERRVAMATLSKVLDFEACAKVEDVADFGQITLGAPVVIQNLSLRRRIELYRRSDLPPPIAAEQEHALDALCEVIASDGRGFLEVCPAGQVPHYQVALDSAGRYELCDPLGKPFQYLEPRVSIGAPSAARAVIAQLLRLGRYHTVLEMSEPASALGDQLEVEILLAPPGWSDDQLFPSTGGTPLKREGDAYSVKTDTWVWLRVRNKTPTSPVNIALLDLNCEWEISLIVPDPSDLTGKKYETVAEVPRTFAFQMCTPVEETIDVLKLFITTGDVDFRLLATACVTHNGTPRAPANNALGRLIDAINAPEHQMRDVRPARSRSSPWIVREMRFRTVGRTRP
jgi:hypothetical protein